MTAAAPLKVIQDALRGHSAVSRMSLAADGSRLQVEATGRARSWQIAITEPRSSGLPEVWLQDEDLRGRLAHVNYPGEVCVTDRDGLSIDTASPGQIGFRVLSDALDVLDQSYADYSAGNYGELLNEFEGYWISLPKSRPVDVHVEIDDRAREIVAVLDDNRNAQALIERRSSQGVLYGGLRRFNALRRERALYLPLTEPLLPPGPKRPLDPRWIRDELGKAIDASPSAAAVRHLLKCWRRRVDCAYILCSQPRGAGRSAFAIQFVGRPAPHPLVSTSEKWVIAPLAVNRHTATYMHARGGGYSALADAHIAIVGCGAVGCRVAEHLALAGVGQLTLVDYDTFSSDNVFRHLLGGEYAGMPKVLALKDHLSRRLPGIVVNTEREQLTEWAAKTELGRFQAIVLAIGVPHEERGFSRRIRTQSAFHGPLVTTWLEPLGLGGHSVCSVAPRPGCLECLYTLADGTSELWPKTSYIAPGQRIARNITGCLGAFTPFSAADATTTALLASRQATAALLGQPFLEYSTWRGNDAECRAAGIRTTKWYAGLSQPEIELAGSEYCRVPCAVCGGRP